jgi:hypothetical protein
LGKDANRRGDNRRCCAIGQCCHNYPSKRTIQIARDTLLRELEPLAFWMQTIFFACLYVAGRGLTGRSPAEIVADCRWASP